MARPAGEAKLRPGYGRRKEQEMKKWFAYGGIAASVVMIAFGVGALAVGITGFNEVRDDIARENIVGTPDSTIPNQKVDTGSEAKAFAAVMRKHTLEATKGQTYAEMGRFLDAKGNPTSDETKAAKGPNGQPVENPVRQLWVTETALTTALNVSYFAERVAVFSMVMGVALILTGIGFLVLTLGGALGKVPAPVPHRQSTTASAATEQHRGSWGGVGGTTHPPLFRAGTWHR
jgi:hypothetical protein